MKDDNFIQELKRKLAIACDIPIELLEEKYEKEKDKRKKRVETDLNETVFQR